MNHNTVYLTMITAITLASIGLLLTLLQHARLDPISPWLIVTPTVIPIAALWLHQLAPAIARALRRAARFATGRPSWH